MPGIIAATGSSDATMNGPWGPCTADNGNRTGTTHRIDTAGRHIPNFWLVLNKIVTTQAV